MTQKVAFKITNLHTGQHIITDSVADAFPQLQDWYVDAPADQWENIDQLLQEFIDNHLEDDVLENELGIRFEEINLETYNHYENLQEAAKHINITQLELDTWIKQRNLEILAAHLNGMPVAQIARAANVTRAIVYKVINRDQDK